MQLGLINFKPFLFNFAKNYTNMQYSVNVKNQSINWNEIKRPRVGCVVTWNNARWQNITGINSEPSNVSNDWIYIGNVDYLIPVEFINKDVAYVDVNGDDSKAILGNENFKFRTTSAASDALPSTGGDIVIGTGSFFSPPKDKIKSNTRFIGSGKPITNSTISYTTQGIQPTISSPTKLVGGTILLGQFDGSLKDGIEIYNLGIDSGLDYCNTYNSGTATDAIFFAQLYSATGGLPSADGQHQLQANSRPRTGIVIENVTTLCKDASSPVHSMLVENVLNAKVSNVSTYYGTHGLVIKGTGVNVNGLDAHGHSADGLIIKSNDYAFCQSVSVSNVYITSIIGYDGGGMILQGADGTSLSLCSISNLNIEYTKFGIKNDSNVTGVLINNVTIYKTQGEGINLDQYVTFSTLSNIEQRNGTNGIVIDNSNSNNIWQLSNVRCSGNSLYGASLYSLGKIFCSNFQTIFNTNEVSKSANVFGTINDENIFNVDSFGVQNTAMVATPTNTTLNAAYPSAKNFLRVYTTGTTPVYTCVKMPTGTWVITPGL